MADDKFSKLCFNELTTKPLCPDTDKDVLYNRVEKYADTLIAALSVSGAARVRYDNFYSEIRLSEKYTLYDFCKENQGNDKFRIVLSKADMCLIKPKEKTPKGDQSQTKVYVTLGEERKFSRGITAAYLLDTPSIGFDSSEDWGGLMHEVTGECDNGAINEMWPCLTQPAHLKNREFKIWLQDHTPVELVKTTLAIREKKINIMDDHGKDLLMAHAKKLCKNEYVEGILCSLEWKRGAKDYIYNKTADGVIEIVLLWTECHYAMRVKTTGRNQKETDAIAEILKKKYGHR